ncbi:MAG: RidA family protein [Alphaproteobacteria bacterium]|mgnify:FL=1|jgi:enamine deaminase RidA (YjgF/YER057c/UK114 family)|nr:RidA family protein [Alphaproteobacteria bacterium]MDP6588314.1 RidA family protein [Alphaproteobacteria bacterium]MDP6816814.1 RidA family protein [Alphaproteobacteria bacterium]
MSKLTHINPDNMAPYLPYGLSHAVAVEGGRTVYLSGQVGWDADGNIVGPDLADQIAQAHDNIRKILADAGATVGDIVRLNTYVVNYAPEDGETVNAANRRLFEGITPPSATLMGVQALYAPEISCEVEATVVVKG